MKKITNHKTLFFVLLLIILFLLNVILINQSFWLDEVFSLNAINASWKEMMDLLVLDVHPPLFYILLKLFQFIGHINPALFKVITILPTFLTMIFVYRFTKRWKQRDWIPFLFVLLLGLSYPFLNYSLELRMYSLSFLFTTLSALFAYNVYQEEKRKDVVLFILTSLGAAYTHYFALAVEMIIYLYLFFFLIKKKKTNIKKAIHISLITILGYLPWLFYFLKQFIIVQGDYWITFSSKDILDWTQFLFLGIHPAFFLLFLLVLGYGLYQRKKQTEENSFLTFGLLLTTIPFVLMIGAIILTLLVRPLFIARYLLPCMPLFYLGIFFILASGKHHKIFFLILLVLFLGTGIFNYQKSWQEEFHNGTMKEIQQIEKESSNDTLFVSNMRYLVSHIMPYYLPNHNIIPLSELKQDEKRFLYFDDISSPSIEQLKEHYEVTFLHSSNIDHVYYFNVYQVTQK